MAEIVNFEKTLWLTSVLLQSALFALLLYRKNYKPFPFFSAYVLVTLLQNAALFVSYRLWGFKSPVSFGVAWATQGLVVVARVLAVTEIFRHVLAKYRGVWALVWRILLAAAGCVLAYSWVVARHTWQLFAVNADRGFELAIAVTIVLLFLSARYYGVRAEYTARALVIGFFLYSCFFVVNDTILEVWMYRYATLWNLLGTLSFLASLVIWNWALREKQPEATLAPEMLSDDVYRQMTPEINSRLRALNDQLNHFWHAEGKRS